MEEGEGMSEAVTLIACQAGSNRDVKAIATVKCTTGNLKPTMTVLQTLVRLVAVKNINSTIET